MRFNRTQWMMLAVCSLLLPASIATAQQSSAEGVVQLGHRADSPCLSSDHCDGCGSGYAEGYGHGSGRGHGNGLCPHQAAARLNGGYCGYGRNPHYSHCGVGHFLNKHSPYHHCTHSPDHGFAPPLHRPMYPTPAIYSRMFPPKWTGEDAGIDPGFRHPTVYMPTDTTQLGYYYQQVPYWRSRQNMIPPVPNPAEWHTPNLGVVFTGYEDAAQSALTGCPAGQAVDKGVSSHGHAMDGAVETTPMQEREMAPSRVIESRPMETRPAAPYSPTPVSPQMVPPAEEAAPYPPAELPAVPNRAAPPGVPAAPAAADLEKSASLPLLIPVPMK